MKNCRGIDRLTDKILPEDTFDFQIPLMSLPEIFYADQEMAGQEVPYLFPDAKLLEVWKTKLQSFSGYRIGIGWQGNPSYRGDRFRSIPLKNFEPLFECQGAQFISLQKGFGTEQVKEISNRASVVDWGSSLDNEAGAFMDTAAVMKNLDLMITSDTAIAHLAGGLGIPVWLALPFIPDWRWQLERTDSPWYPTMRLFRQETRGDWSAVFSRMRTELERTISIGK